MVPCGRQRRGDSGCQGSHLTFPWDALHRSVAQLPRAHERRPWMMRHIKVADSYFNGCSTYPRQAWTSLEISCVSTTMIVDALMGMTSIKTPIACIDIHQQHCQHAAGHPSCRCCACIPQMISALSFDPLLPKGGAATAGQVTAVPGLTAVHIPLTLHSEGGNARPAASSADRPESTSASCSKLHAFSALCMPFT